MGTAPFDPANLKWAAEYGALFILAMVMFYFYRSDRKERESDLKEENTQLVQAILANTAILSSLKSTLEQNSRVVETLAGHCVAVQTLRMLSPRSKEGGE